MALLGSFFGVEKMMMKISMLNLESYQKERALENFGTPIRDWPDKGF
jgi:hypothetical protein